MIHITSLLHTMTLYANRWGGQRYRTSELAKFLNKHLYNVQEIALMMGKCVSLNLAHDAFLSSDHTPLYANSIQVSPTKKAFKIKDELGFEAVFAEGTEILTYYVDPDYEEYNEFKWIPIEKLMPRQLRVINLEKVDVLKNDKTNHHLKFTENFIAIKCEPEERQMLMCDGLSALMILKESPEGVEKIAQFDSNNIQEIYAVEIKSVEEAKSRNFFNIDFHEFSYSLSKNRELSDKSKNRYYEYRKATLTKRWLEKMRSKVFRMKKDKINFTMELTKNESD